jgi:hypothetical protein
VVRQPDGGIEQHRTHPKSQKPKNLAAGYSLTNVIKIEPFIGHALQLLEGQLDGLSSMKQPIKFEQWFNCLAFDVLGEATFSQSFGFLEAGKDIGHTVANNVFLRIYLSILGHFPWAHDYLLANPLVEYFNMTPLMYLFVSVGNHVTTLQLV